MLKETPPSALARQRNRTIPPLPSFPNVTIAGTGLRALVYLPNPTKGYYRSSRYDWGSMVGQIQLEVPNGGGNVTICTDARPRPHRPLLSDHVLGFAAEFGCGVRGTLCSSGHGHNTLATNGVLGYSDAGRGGTFAKIGVGKLLRPPKLRADGYNYNFSWTYKLAEPPKWSVTRLDDGSGVVLEQALQHKRWGWALRRKIYSCGRPGKRPTLCVDLTLTNKGEQQLRTPYASGNAFNLAAGPATGPRFAVTFNVPGSAYHHDHGRSAKSSSTLPMSDIADMTMREGAGQSKIVVRRPLGEGEHASVNFNVTNTTLSWDGRYMVSMPAAKGWNLLVRHSMWRDLAARRSGWYGFNVRISRRAVAPRPFLLFDLEPGQSVDVSHRYEFDWKPTVR